MAKQNSVIDKITWCEDQLQLAYRYIDTDEGSDLRIFRPLFDKKLDANGNALPPHKDWRRNVFIKRRERAIVRLNKLLRRIEGRDHERRSNRRAKRTAEPPA